MQVNQVIGTFKKMYMQNISDDMFGDDGSYLYLWLYSSIMMVFMFMNSRMEWDHSSMNETFEDETEVELEYYPVALEVVDDEGNQYTRCTRGFDFYKGDKDYAYTLKGNKLTFHREISKINIWYKRLPKEITKEDLSAQLDVPDSLIPTVMFLMSYQILPSHYSEGAQLAQNYQNTAMTVMNEYLTAYGFTTGDTVFTA